MANDLVQASDLDKYPGSPFDQAVVDAAVAAVRREAGWHITPVKTETITVDSAGGVVLFLPTMRLVSVTAIRDLTDQLTPVTLDGWRASASGMVYRDRGWPLGFSLLEVDLVHGYAVRPPDLLKAVAERCQWETLDATVSQRVEGPFSTAFREARSGNSNLDPYRLPVRA